MNLTERQQLLELLLDAVPFVLLDGAGGDALPVPYRRRM
jgi:hypothetical protein